MKASDVIWNRAAEGGGAHPLGGDQALAALLVAHGLVMNGGVLHAAEVLGADEIRAACEGYVRFGFASIVSAIERAAALVAADDADQLEDAEATLDAEYAAAIPDDGVLVSVFERYLERRPV